MQTLTLKPHPDTLASAPQATLTASLNFDGHKLRVQFFFASKMSLLVQRPNSMSGARRDELWKHTCFEIFFGPHGDASYWEINVSPSGDWNMYAFDSYRDGMRPETRISDPKLHHFKESEEGVLCEFAFDLAPLGIRGKIDLGATAVIETEGGHKSYWATAHAGDKPDFHLRKSFSHSTQVELK